MNQKRQHTTEENICIYYIFEKKYCREFLLFLFILLTHINLTLKSLGINILINYY